MDNDLVEHIKLCKERNEESILYMLHKFNGLLIKFSKILRYEDAINDLCEHFTITLYKMPEFDNNALIVSYIYNSIKNQYIKLSNKQNSYNDKIILTSEFFYEKVSDDFQEKISLYELINQLPSRQKRIIILFYFYGYSIEELSHVFNVSRQTVNKCKNIALSNMREN